MRNSRTPFSLRSKYVYKNLKLEDLDSRNHNLGVVIPLASSTCHGQKYIDPIVHLMPYKGENAGLDENTLDEFKMTEKDDIMSREKNKYRYDFVMTNVAKAAKIREI